jgi:hypothetical protein
MLHKILSERLIAKKVMICLLSLPEEDEIERYIEIPIRMKRTVHTIPKVMSGGVRAGLISSYHWSILVKNEPTRAVRITARAE